MTSADYEFLVRNARTLQLLGELRPQDVTASWTRRDVDAGSFQLSVPREAVTNELMALHNVIEIRRSSTGGAEREFVGVVETRRLDAFGTQWTLEGPDLLGFWLTQRIVGFDEAVAKTGVGETVIKAFVDENLGSAADAARRASADLTGLTWQIEADGARGSSVDFRTIRSNLLTDVTSKLCRMSDLLQDVVPLSDYSGYEYRITEPVDATASTGGTPFAVGWDNVEQLEYRQDYRRAATVLYVLGDGSGDTRNVTTVTDSDAVNAHFRRERTFDARYATTGDQRTELGQLELERHDAATQSMRARPLRTSENARYREDWDIGHDITIAVPEADIAVDRRVVAATVALTRAAGEEISFELGVNSAESVFRRLDERLRQLAVASNE